MATPVSPNQSSFATRQSSVRNEATETVGAEVPVQRTKSGVTFPLDVDEPMDDELAQQTMSSTFERGLARMSVVQSADVVIKKVAQDSEAIREQTRPLPCLSILDSEQRPLLLLTFKALIGTTIFLSGLFLILLFLFFGFAWEPSDYCRNLRIAVVDFDGGVVGQALALVASKTPFGTEALVTSSLEDVMRRVGDGGYHAAWVAMPGASARLFAAAFNASAPYNPAGAFLFVFDEGRGGSSLASLLPSASASVASGMSNFLTEVIVGATPFFTPPAGALLSSLNPAVIVGQPGSTAPVGATKINLHPVTYTGEHTAVGLAFIDYWIIMLIATNVMLKLADLLDEKGIRRDQQVVFRLTWELLISGALALWPPVVLAGLKTPIHTRTFFAWWAFVWLCLLTFGSIITFFLKRFGEAGGNLLQTLFLVLQLTSSGGVNPVELCPSFFKSASVVDSLNTVDGDILAVGLGLPFFNAIQGSRHIVFQSYDRLGRNIGVLFGWMGFVILFAISRMRLYRRELRKAGAIK